ncbi:MAG: FkbM family methyltransferase [Gammaproteobacteria bacterium]
MLPRLIDDNEHFNALVKARYGYMLFNRNDRYIGQSIARYGEWSEGEMVVFRKLLQTGDCVVEAGANIGSHTLGLATLVGPKGIVHAYEPQRLVFQTLNANISINSLSNVVTHCCAVGAEHGAVNVPRLDPCAPANFGGLGIDVFGSGDQVQVVPLDEHIDVRSIKLIKADVEGMELEVIKGAAALITKHKPFLYLEADRDIIANELIAYIKNLEYRVMAHQPRLFSPNNYAGDSENIFDDIASNNIFCFHRSLKVEFPPSATEY